MMTPKVIDVILNLRKQMQIKKQEFKYLVVSKEDYEQLNAWWKEGKQQTNITMLFGFTIYVNDTLNGAPYLVEKIDD
jgi:hypothetical protein